MPCLKFKNRIVSIFRNHKYICKSHVLCYIRNQFSTENGTPYQRIFILLQKGPIKIQMLNPKFNQNLEKRKNILVVISCFSHFLCSVEVTQFLFPLKIALFRFRCTFRRPNLRLLVRHLALHQFSRHFACRQKTVLKIVSSLGQTNF